MISAFKCTHALADSDEPKFNCGTFTDGMFQFYLAPVLFGWIWSILFGIALYKNGRDFNKLTNAR